MTRNVVHLFIYILAILIYFLFEGSNYQSNLKTGFLSSDYQTVNVLYIFWMQVLHQIYVKNIFSISLLACLFHFLNGDI